MGLTHSKIKLSNPRRSDLEPVEILALADTGAVHLCIPEHIAIQLDLNEVEKREVTLADGSKRKVSYVGPIRVDFMNRTGFTGALVLGDEALIGAIPTQEMDLAIIPSTHQLTVNHGSLSEIRNRSEGKLGLGMFFSVLRRIAPLCDEAQREIAQIQLFCSRFPILRQTPISPNIPMSVAKGLKFKCQ